MLTSRTEINLAMVQAKRQLATGKEQWQRDLAADGPVVARGQQRPALPQGLLPRAVLLVMVLVLKALLVAPTIVCIRYSPSPPSLPMEANSIAAGGTYHIQRIPAC